MKPTQIRSPPPNDISGAAETTTGVVVVEVHPVELSVNVKVAEPLESPVTVPLLLTLATNGLLLTHVPPVFGSNNVVVPTQIAVFPLTVANGRDCTTSCVDC